MFLNEFIIEEAALEWFSHPDAGDSALKKSCKNIT